MLDLNPIEVLKKRRLKFLPVHFSKINLERSFHTFELESWIKSKLKGRYFLGNNTQISKENKVKIFTSVAFDDQKELTYFMLACQYLRRN